jgi:hypothetical protein
MKKSRLIGGALACGLVLVPIAAFAAFYTAPNPTLTVTSAFTGLLFKRHDVVSFSGSDYCGDALHTAIDPKHPAPVEVACGHTVFVGLWEPGPSGTGFWAQSTTFQSSPGGFRVYLANVGRVSGSFDVYCGDGNAELYAYDLDEGTLLTGASVPSFACVRLKQDDATDAEPAATGATP